MLGWGRKSPQQTVKRFIEAMNTRDFKQVEKLLADDFRIVDNSGRALHGREQSLALLHHAERTAPDFRLVVSAMSVRGDDILISGKAETSDFEMGNTTQWRARANNSQMLEWQSYGPLLSPSMVATMQRGREVAD